MLFMLKFVNKPHELYIRDQFHEVMTPDIFVVKDTLLPFLTVLPCAICIFHGRTDTRVYLRVGLVKPSILAILRHIDVRGI